jgi:hypothetical protein
MKDFAYMYIFRDDDTSQIILAVWYLKLIQTCNSIRLALLDDAERGE